MEVLNKQGETGGKNFIGPLIISETIYRKLISRKEKGTFKVVGHYVTFLLVIFLPSTPWLIVVWQKQWPHPSSIL